MMEIRYKSKDASAWIDMLFAPVYIIIAYSIGWQKDPMATENLLFWLLLFYATIRFVEGVIRWREVRIGRLYCRIDQDGLRFFNHLWFKGWKWSQVDFIAWHEVETVSTAPWCIQFSPKLWLKRFGRYIVFHNSINLMPQITYKFGDKSPAEIIAGIKKLAPNANFEIASAKSSNSR